VFESIFPAANFTPLTNVPPILSQALFLAFELVGVYQV
jgi:hypothetical protein